MKKLMVLPRWKWKPAIVLGVVLMLGVALGIFSLGQNFEAQAQEPPGGGNGNLDQPIEQSQMTAEQSGAVNPEFPIASLYTDEPPTLTDEQIEQLERAQANTNLTLPTPAEYAATNGDAADSGKKGKKGKRQESELAPAPGSETALTVAELGNVESAAQGAIEPGPLTHSDPSLFTFFRLRDNWPGAAIPAGNQSNVQETSVAQSGRFAWATGNWYAARSADGGFTWTYRNPFSDMADFCCDQVIIHDAAHDRFLWYRQAVTNAAGNNRFVLTVINGLTNAEMCSYSFTSTLTNPTNNWYDYPHLQMGADNLYVATNVFSGNSWTRTQMLRIPTTPLSNCATVNFLYFTDTENFTFVPVQGARHTMYFASNWARNFVANRIRIYRWHEDSGTINSFLYATPAFTPTFRGNAFCPSADGHNWAARYDQRVLTGARYQIMGTNVKHPGRQVLGFWWNVQEGGFFPRPYVDGFAVFEDNLSVVPGGQGRPLVWNRTACYAYPSITPNKLGDLGMIINWAVSGVGNPNVAVGIADDFTTAPPGWVLRGVRNSNNHPSDSVWGDYNTVREFEPTERFWIASSHYISSELHCSRCARAVYVIFGRSRDHNNYIRWVNR